MIVDLNPDGSMDIYNHEHIAEWCKANGKELVIVLRGASDQGEEPDVIVPSANPPRS